MATQNERRRSFVVPGLVGPALFFLVMLVAGAMTPGYDALARFVSELSIGPLGWIMITNFVVFGVLVVLFAIGLWRGFGSSASGKAGAALIAIAGVGLIFAGLFVADMESTTATASGAIHDLASVVVFLGLTLACFAFAWRFRSDRVFALYSLVTGVLIPPLFLATPSGGDLLGLIQRILIAIAWTWLTVLAIRLDRQGKGVIARGTAHAIV